MWANGCHPVGIEGFFHELLLCSSHVGGGEPDFVGHSFIVLSNCLLIFKYWGIVEKVGSKEKGVGSRE
jgi:hypothetical protein